MKTIVSGRTRWPALAVAALLLAACADRTNTPHVRIADLPKQPNIVFVLTDDLSTNLIAYMPHVLALEKAGTTFSNYTVSDSFCCPSRASILTGDYPHNTGVFTNRGPDGGFRLFHRRHEEDHTFATALQAVGYRTAFMGKYLNGYVPNALRNWVPPGWTVWDAAGYAYTGYNYFLNENHLVEWFGHRPQDYLTDVLSERGATFISRSAAERRPFLLEVATYAPHLPATAAPQDAGTFAHLSAPRGPDFNRTPTNPPTWLAGKHLGAADWPTVDRVFRSRVRAVQAVDRMIGRLEATLRATGQLARTIFVFSSDNGFHDGEHGLYPGKLTAFDTDIEVPLVVAGPHIPADRIDASVVQNVDLAPTFEQIAGATVSPDVDGSSFLPLLLGKSVPWRDAALVEHHGGDFRGDNPDQQTPRAGNPSTYEAIRTADYTYVFYSNGEREYYDHRNDPYQLHNAYDTLSASRVAELDAQVRAMSVCNGRQQCWAAAQSQLSK